MFLEAFVASCPSEGAAATVFGKRMAARTVNISSCFFVDASGCAVRVVLSIQDTLCCRSSCTTRMWLSPRLKVFSSSSVASSGIGVPLMLVYAVRVVLSIHDTYVLPIRLCHAVLADASHQLFFPLVIFS